MFMAPITTYHILSSSQIKDSKNYHLERLNEYYTKHSWVIRPT